MASISPPCVESNSAPRMVRWRWIGTATETMVSPAGLIRTTLAACPPRDCCTSGKTRPLVGPIVSIRGGRSVTKETAGPVPGALQKGRFGLVEGRQVEPQDIAARIEGARIQDEHGITVINPRAGARGRDQAPQQRGDTFRIDREFQRREHVLGQSRGLAQLHLQQGIRIDLDGVDFHCGRGGDGAGDDLALRHQALHTGLDQTFAELVEIEKAHQERHQPAPD